MTIQTEFDFVLPKGYVDENGTLHRDGTMRMATAMDEIAPLRDPRVRNNEAYLVVILLSQVITRLGSLNRVTPTMIEHFFAAGAHAAQVAVSFHQNSIGAVARSRHGGSDAAGASADH